MYDFSVLTSDEAVTKVRATLRIRKALLGVLALFFAVAAMASVFFAIAPLDQSIALKGLAICVLTLSLSSIVLVGNRHQGLHLTLVGLTPLSETEDCRAALALCRRSEEAQRVRERVLATGRQLYQFDLDEMRAKSQVESEAQSLARQAAAEAAACKELHGLSV